ncbi:MAG TPA: ATP-binding protein [Polyangiaceae bacterium]|nr:ATP-binding protein [Polyangiaceae bacterium]
MAGKTLKSKLLRIIVTTMLAVGSVSLSVIGWTSYEMERDRLTEIERQIRASISSEAARLAASHALALKGLVADNAFGDVKQLVTDAVRLDSDVVYGLFVGNNGKVWVYTSPRQLVNVGREGAVPSEIPELELGGQHQKGASFAQRTIHAFGEELEEYSAPVMGDDGERLGTVVYGFSNQRTREAVAAAEEGSRRALARALTASVGIGVLSLLVGIMWVLSSAARITRPVTELTDAAHQISSGKRGIRVAISSGDEIETLAAAFNQMLEANEDAMRKLEITTEQALAADRMKSEFLANTSHEIRTPMNGVLGMVQLIQAMPLDGKLRRYVETIGASANALLTTINDILDFSKMEAGKFSIVKVPFDPANVALEVAELLASRARDKRIELVYRAQPELPAMVLGDPDRFRQVLNNLVGNAVKFTDGGEVFVDVGVVSRDEQSIVLQVAVRDTGIGIDPKDLPKLYQAFSQADGTRVRRYGGTGLGLVICKRLVNMMGGEIHVESQVGRGSTFTFTASFGVAEPGQSLRSERNRAAIRQQRVLLFEPQQRWCEIIDEHLVAWELDVVKSPSSSHALESLKRAAAQNTPFHAAILSADAEDMPIVTLVRSIRADPLLQDLRLVVVATPSPGVLAELEGEVFNEVHKPIRFSDLYNCLVGAMSSVTRHAAARKSSRPPPAPGRRILVVDDNDINRFVAVEELAQRGYATDEAANGQEAFEKFKAGEYLCILMDCQMPVMDGCDAASAIRRFEGEHGRTRTPIIALTAHALIGERERVLAAGMDDFLSKPFRSSSLERILLQHTRPEPEAAPAAPALLDLDPQATRSEKLIGLFLDRLPSQLDLLRAALESQSTADARALAHKIKGSCLALAALRMSNTAERIQRHVEQTELPAAMERFRDLENEYACVAKLLNQELSQRRPSTVETRLQRG